MSSKTAQYLLPHALLLLLGWNLHVFIRSRHCSLSYASMAQRCVSSAICRCKTFLLGKMQ